MLYVGYVGELNTVLLEGGVYSSQGFQLTLKLRQEALRWDWASGPGNQVADVLGWHAR